MENKISNQKISPVSQAPDCACQKVRALAAEGLTESEIARRLFMSIGSFQKRKRDSPELRAAYRAGLREARSARLKAKAKRRGGKNKPCVVMDAEISVPELRRVDRLVRKAARDGARRYREFCRATGLDDRQVVKSLERLQLHSMVRKVEGLFFDEWVVL